MSDPRRSHDFDYVHSDIPDGMRIGEWRIQRAAERMVARMSGRAARRCRRRHWLLGWIRPWRAPAPRPPVRGRPAHG
jgi:hypothetical protein